MYILSMYTSRERKMAAEIEASGDVVEQHECAGWDRVYFVNAQSRWSRPSRFTSVGATNRTSKASFAAASVAPRRHRVVSTPSTCAIDSFRVGAETIEQCRDRRRRRRSPGRGC